MEVVSFAIIIIFAVIVFYIFGVTLLPYYLTLIENRVEGALIAPLIGLTVWIAVTVAGGFLFPYNTSYILACIILAVFWVIWRKNRLFLPRNSFIGLAVLFLFCSAVVLCWLAYPRWIDGLIYFNANSYDFTRCAIVNSITTYGILPRNPWLADNGEPVVLVYYFGWCAFASQFQMLTGSSSIFAECAIAGVTYFISALAMLGVCMLTFTGKRKLGVVLFLFYFVIVCAAKSTARYYLPEAVLSYMFPNDRFAGFWYIYSNYLWVPHHMLAGSIIVLIIMLYCKLLLAKEHKKELAVLIGFLGAGAAMNSVYAGCFGLVVLLGVILVSLGESNLRAVFYTSFKEQLLLAATCLVLVAQYLYYLISYPSEQFPLSIGVIPSYGTLNSLQGVLISLACFYWLFLPARIGLTYVFGLIAVSYPGLLPINFTARLMRRYLYVWIILIGCVHSSYYSNDFGWRGLSAGQIIMAYFSVQLTLRLYDYARNNASVLRRGAGYFLLALIAGYPLFCYRDFVEINHNINIEHAYAEIITDASRGWQVIKEHTARTDMVLSNPDEGISSADVRNGGFRTNVFYSLFADRPTPMGDLIFSKCYSEYYNQEKLEKRFHRVVRFFRGSPFIKEVSYIADELKVKAILVTPWDGLWHRPGAIGEKYPIVIEGKNYRVYLRE